MSYLEFGVARFLVDYGGNRRQYVSGDVGNGQNLNGYGNTKMNRMETMLHFTHCADLANHYSIGCQHYPHTLSNVLVNPVLCSTVVMIMYLKLFDIDYPTYHETVFIDFWLKPAVN